MNLIKDEAITKKKIFFLLTYITYILLISYAFKELKTDFIILKTILLLAFFNFLFPIIRIDRKLFLGRNSVIFLFWAYVILSFRYEDVFKEMPIASLILFVAYIPFVFLLKPSFSWIIKFVLVLLFFTMTFLGDYKPMAETYSELVYLCLSLLVIIGLRDIILGTKHL